MNKDQLNSFFKQIKIGFWKRLTICAGVIVSATLFNLFVHPAMKLFWVGAFLVFGELFIYCYLKTFLTQIKMSFMSKGVECPLPDELKALANEMHVKIKKVKVVPKLFNAYVSRGQLFIGEDLLNNFDSTRLMGTVAHEYAHIKEKHIAKMMLVVWPVSLMVLVGWSTLPLAMLYVGFAALIMVISTPMRWRFERGADLTAIKYVGKEPLKAALLALEPEERRDMLSETHPSINKRIQWIDEVKI